MSSTGARRVPQWFPAGSMHPASAFYWFERSRHAAFPRFHQIMTQTLPDTYPDAARE